MPMVRAAYLTKIQRVRFMRLYRTLKIARSAPAPPLAKDQRTQGLRTHTGSWTTEVKPSSVAAPTKEQSGSHP